MKIFLASSNELNHEREYLAGVVFYLGRLLHDMGAEQRVELVKWEYLDSSMGVEHKQDEYNRELATCDAAVVLFWRKFGEYTESEFRTALTGIRSGEFQRRLVVLFKDTGEEMAPELGAFRRTLATGDGIASGTFSSDVELRANFLTLVFAVMAEIDPTFRLPSQVALVRYGLA